jgi:predicted ATPase
MRLVSFALSKYRSIISSERLALGDFTVLIGPNNEGKSNILQGLISGMKMLSNMQRLPPNPSKSAMSNRILVRDLYNWESDFPKNLQSRNPNGMSIFEYHFELTATEITEFRTEVKSSLNGLLPIRLSIGDDTWAFDVTKRGRGGPALSKKRLPIARFISTRINPREIPTIRTAASSTVLIDEMVGRELRKLEGSPAYQNALQKISSLQQPILENLGNNLRDQVQEFLPDVRSIRIELPDRAEALRRNSRLYVDDGTETELKSKGDGVQSLTALALTRQAAQDAAQGRELVLAIEEPEAHLHPKAIHQLKKVLTEISQTQQVVVTTHSPLFANKHSVGSNVIVDKKKAKKALSIGQIRDCLGVRMSDNLSAAEVILVCEGTADKRSLEALLPSLSTTIKAALDGGLIAVDTMHGSSNLSYKTSTFLDQLCKVHAFVDNDNAGRSSADVAKREGLLKTNDITYATSIGMKDSEFEDLLDPALYSPAILRAYTVDLSKGSFSSRKKKWTDRIKDAFMASGQHWDDSVCAEVKTIVAAQVEAHPTTALKSEYRGAIDSLVTALVVKLKNG